MYSVTDVETFIVTGVPSDRTAVPVVTYVAYILCAVMMTACIRTSGVRIVIVSKIRVRPIIGNKNTTTKKDSNVSFLIMGL